MKMAIVQMDIAFGEPEKNFLQVDSFISQAAKQDADVIVFPEMWNTGYALKDLEKLADKNGEQTKNMLSRLAKQHAIHVVGGSVATKKAQGFFNTMYVANRNGDIVAEYDKAHLFPLMDEPVYMQPGQAKNIFELDRVECGGVICFDLRFPEWIRAHVLDGAKIMFIPAEWPKQRMDHWEILLQARAIENQCFVVAANRVGSDPDNEYNGHSMIISPRGEVYLSSEEGEGIFYADIPLDEVDRVRNTIPIFRARRPELY
ncbi:carbon-nitrogen family hydrolase [Heyndrickxia coagulans]|uniref:carbon-nitrogen family hydrolase n=1 Tax=Heyndrickxia coagulans TaxID=1398 RepID=UPI001F1FF898|nr:carbon-nitrogen family hydrolase [Heyndrickxia coagulans]UJZ87097.1 carbon-nitrogen family hydrolase [Heyndrickxia coagulans]